MLTDDEFRTRLRDILAQSGLSMRALSAALGRDPGYVAALLDPTRPSRAHPTPADLLSASDATGIPFVELLEALWGIEPQRLADELALLGLSGPSDGQLAARERRGLMYALMEFADRVWTGAWRRDSPSASGAPRQTPLTLGRTSTSGSLILPRYSA